MHRFLRILIISCLISVQTKGQSIPYEKLAVTYGLKHIPTLRSYLSIPCDANVKEDMYKNIEWVQNAFSSRGFSVSTLETPTLPVLLLERKAKNPAAKTVLFYYHSDGQPVRATEWQQENPFIPVLKQKKGDAWVQIPFERITQNYDPEWRIFGRASSDDKGPGVMLLAALDAIESLAISPNYHLKILVDFEEEKGSTSLPGIIEKNRKALESDLLLIFDGPAHPTNLPTITFGARGILTLTLTTYGPVSPLHSGHYGNYVPNPVFRMARLLTNMKAEDGRVLIPGFYEGIQLDPITAKQIAAVPDDLATLNSRLGIAQAEKVGTNYQESLIYPSLNVRGIKAAEVGAMAATIIPDKAVAEIDIRTVRASEPARLIELVKKFIRDEGYYIVTNEPTAEERAKYDKIIKIGSRPAYGAFSTEMQSEVGLWIQRAIQKTTSQPLVKLPTMGGSVPISPFVAQLGVNAVIVPTVNTDNNQHSANENLRLGNYFEGIRTMIGLLTEKF